jgi:hypothetical protein
MQTSASRLAWTVSSDRLSLLSTSEAEGMTSVLAPSCTASRGRGGEAVWLELHFCEWDRLLWHLLILHRGAPAEAKLNLSMQIAPVYSSRRRRRLHPSPSLKQIWSHIGSELEQRAHPRRRYRSVHTIGNMQLRIARAAPRVTRCRCR